MNNQDIRTILLKSPQEVGRRILGSLLVRQLDNGNKIICRIVETEAYDQQDIASHSYKGQTKRNSVMFGPAGHLYVYFTYGMHYCCNIVTGQQGVGEAVLIRAVEPISGWEEIFRKRPGKSKNELTNGPAKLTQALSIDKNLNGHDLLTDPLKLELLPEVNDKLITVTRRIGIRQGQDKLWRYYLNNNIYVSRLNH